MSEARPEPGNLVRVRTRQYLVEEVTIPPDPRDQTLVRLSCLDDDAQGTVLEVLWERELDAKVMGAAQWDKLGTRGFDPARRFWAYLNTLRWNCVTSTDPRLFQAPYRAGIEVQAFQLEPLRKALLLPRVNLFIADDVGLGKTIEAGLILRELIQRQKVRRVVVACPASVVRQWQEEMEQRFGILFEIFDRKYVLERRCERGYSVNPWDTHSRFIVSHALLRNEEYAAPLRNWLGNFSPGSLLILDEAHNAAPATSSKYAVDSQLTAAVRDVARRFEHRLFLSATPHNGHSNSFAALLEILDDQRFCRGVPVRTPKLRDEVMVRRLKTDLRKQLGGFPERKVVQVDLSGLPEDTPELVLARLLQDYAEAREQRFSRATRGRQQAAMLILHSLQKRLLSSVEAFALSLRAHRRGLDRKGPATAADTLDLLAEAPSAGDDRAELPEEDLEQEAAEQMELATAEAGTEAPVTPDERSLLDRMTEIAEQARHEADARVRWLVAWMRKHLFEGGRWNNRRVLIFTEYTDTKRYLVQRLEEAFTDVADFAERIDTFTGDAGGKAKQEIKKAFNSDPAKHPLRVLIATDAAREGVNLQAFCADLIHFDVPWNPGRMEQRNGRIDRKLQPSPEVRCYYFLYAQREEDRVLSALVKKTERIQQELGSLSPVVERRLARMLDGVISRRRIPDLLQQIHTEDTPEDQKAVVAEELEETREREAKLAAQIEVLQNMLQRSREFLGLEEGELREVVSLGLELQGAPPLQCLDEPTSPTARYTFPRLDQLPGADPSWADTLDALREPRKPEQKPWDWRREAPLRPVVFQDPGRIDDSVVHLHLEHRVVKRLLGRFISQGFVYEDLSRACVGQSRDAIPRVVLLGRLSLFGEGGARLHEEVIPVAARWLDPATGARLKAYAEDDRAEEHTLNLLERALVEGDGRVPEPVQRRLLETARRDVQQLHPELESRAKKAEAAALKRLRERGEREAKEMVDILQGQKKRIEKERQRQEQTQLTLDLDDERRQLEADRRYWARRLESLARELEEEPARIRASYDHKAQRLEPVGLIYLWPVSG